MTEGDRDQGSVPEHRYVRIAGCGESLPIADTCYVRNVSVLVLRANVPSITMWYGVCSTCRRQCEAQSSARLASLASDDHSTQASQRRIANALLSTRSHREREKTGAAGERALPHVEGSADSVSDGEPLLHVPMTQVLDPCTPCQSRKRETEFKASREVPAAIRTIKDSRMLSRT